MKILKSFWFILCGIISIPFLAIWGVCGLIFLAFYLPLGALHDLGCEVTGKYKNKWWD